MKWKKIIKGPIPVRGNHEDPAWKEMLSQEAGGQCVFCCIYENSFGGIRNFHTEHYRPKAKFPALIDDYNNLFYACAICNTFKGSYWPNDPLPDHSIPAIPSPAEHDYCSIFSVSIGTLHINGLFPASKLLEERLYLNRPQLVMERKELVINSKLLMIRQKVAALKSILIESRASNAKKLIFVIKIQESLDRILGLTQERARIRPYSQSDIRRR